MLIAIISDVHNNEVNLAKVLNYCKSNEVRTIICCGDLASEETLNFLNDNFSGTIHYTFGNMDNDQLRDLKYIDQYKKTILYRNFGEIEIDENPVNPNGHGARKIAFVHFPEEAKELCQSKKYDFVFYGHTHKPWTEKIGKCEMLNPGNVAGELYPPTFAVWNTEEGSFILLRVHDLK